MYVTTSRRPCFSKHALSSVIFIGFLPPTLIPRRRATYWISEPAVDLVFLGARVLAAASVGAAVFEVADLAAVLRAEVSVAAVVGAAFFDRAALVAPVRAGP